MVIEGSRASRRRQRRDLPNPNRALPLLYAHMVYVSIERFDELMVRDGAGDAFFYGWSVQSVFNCTEFGGL